MWLDNLGGRKFVLAVLSLIAGSVISILSPKGLSTELVALILGTLSAFSVSNAVLSHKAMTSGASEEGEAEPAAAAAPPAPVAQQVDLAPIYDALNDLHGKIQDTAFRAEASAQAVGTLQQAMDTTQKVAKAALSLRGGGQ